jgi:hypothetical protein
MQKGLDQVREYITRHYAEDEQAFAEFRRRKPLRRFLDIVLYIMAFTQMALRVHGTQ